MAANLSAVSETIVRIDANVNREIEVPKDKYLINVENLLIKAQYPAIGGG